LSRKILSSTKNLFENIKSLDVETQCKIFKMPSIKFSQRMRKNKYDLIIADPPFFKYDIFSVVENMKTNEFLNPASFMIIETFGLNGFG